MASSARKRANHDWFGLTSHHWLRNWYKIFLTNLSKEARSKHHVTFDTQLKIDVINYVINYYIIQVEINFFFPNSRSNFTPRDE